MPPEIVLAAGRFDAAQSDGEQPGHGRCGDRDCGRVHHEHGRTFGAWSYESSRPLSLKALREAASRLPNDVYRAKGVIHSTDDPVRRAILQVVGKRVDSSLDEQWGARTPRTRIAVIGAPGALEGDALSEWFEPCAGIEGA